MLHAVRTARAKALATEFIGVRLTPDELALLERFQTEHGVRNRSEALRTLVRQASEERAGTVPLPATLRNELEELIEDGYANDLDGLVPLVLVSGIRELARTHPSDLATLRDHARSVHQRRVGRRHADREGRGLLRR